MRKCLQVHGASGETVQRQHHDAADQPADKSDEQGLDDEREHHGRSAKSERAHRGNLPAAFRHSGIHGVERSKNGANRHHSSHQAAQHGNQRGQAIRLFRVVVDLPRHVHVEARIGSGCVLQLLQCGRRGEMHGYGLEINVRAIEGGPDQVRVAPDVRVKRAAAGVENAHNLPVHAAQADGIPKRQPGIRSVGILPHDNFVESRRKHPALNDLNISSNLQNILGDAANFHVGVGSRRNQRYGSNQHHLGCHERATVRPFRDTRLVLDDLDGVDGHAAGHFGSSPGTHNDGVVFGPGRDERGFEPAGQRQHGDEHSDGTRDPHHRHNRRAPARFYAPEVVNNRDSHVTLSLRHPQPASASR